MRKLHPIVKKQKTCLGRPIAENDPYDRVLLYCPVCGKRTQTTYENPKDTKPTIQGRFSGIDFDRIEIEVIWVDADGEEWSNTSVGKSKAEAFANFFIENPDVCFNMIEDYNFF